MEPLKRTLILGVVALILFIVNSSSAEAVTCLSLGYKNQSALNVNVEGRTYTDRLTPISINLSALKSSGHIVTANYTDIALVSNTGAQLPIWVEISPYSNMNSTIWFSFTESTAQLYHLCFNKSAGIGNTRNISSWVLYGAGFDNETTGVVPNESGMFKPAAGATNLVSTTWSFPTWQGNKSWYLLDLAGAGTANPALRFNKSYSRGIIEFYIYSTTGAQDGYYIFNLATATHRDTGTLAWGAIFCGVGKTNGLCVEDGANFRDIGVLYPNAVMTVRMEWDGATARSNYTLYNTTFRNRTENVAWKGAAGLIDRVAYLNGQGANNMYYDNIKIINITNGQSNLDPNVSIGALISSAPIMPPVINIQNPHNDTYWNVSSAYAQWVITDDGAGLMQSCKTWHNGTLFSDFACNKEVVYGANLSQDMTSYGTHNLTIYVRDAEGANTTTSVYWTVEDYDIVSESHEQFVNETSDVLYNLTVKYNYELIQSVKALISWNGSEFYENTSSSNHSTINNNSYFMLSHVQTVPLVALNHTNITYHYQFNFTWHGRGLSYGNSSSYTQNITYAYWLSYVDTDSFDYLEGETMTGYAYIRVHGTKATLAVWLDMDYNSTRNETYLISSYTGTTLRVYTRAFSGHTVNASVETLNLTGTLSVSYAGNSRMHTANSSLNVSKLTITNCSYGALSLVFHFYNETDFTEKPAYVSLAYFNINSGHVFREYSFENLTENVTHGFCIYPTWATPRADIFLRYQSSDSPERQYYLNRIELSSAVQYVNAFLLNSTYAYYTNIYVYEQNSARMPNAYVRVLKMNPITTIYETMFIGRTDSEGVLPTYLYPLTQPYKFFIIDAENNLLYTTDAENIPCVSGYCPPYEKHIYVTSELSGYVSFEGITDTITWNNVTGALDISIVDSTGVSDNIKITVYQLNELGSRIAYYEATTNTSSASYSAILPNATYGYLVVISVEENGEYYQLTIEELRINTVKRLGNDGVILGIVILLVFMVAGFFIWNVTGGIIGAVAGVFIDSKIVLGLIPIDTVGVAALGLLGLILVYVVNRE